MAPRTIGRYEVEHLLGTGAFGDVYLATLYGAMGFRKRVAIKVIGKDRPGCDPRKIGGFVNEARLGETLHHPNIVAIVEFGQDQGDYFLVMEYIDGISLQGIQALCAGRGVRLPEDAVCEIGVQVCAGLDHAHNATSESGERLDLVHRDLKPANLMVDRTGTVRIVDFGIARASTNPYFTTQTGEVKGTPRYMAPEQVTGSGSISPLVDIYSLGLVLCEMATNKPVFAAANIEALLYQVLNGDVTESASRLRKVAPSLYPVVLKALRREPHERYQTAAEMSEQLREVWWALGGRQRMGLVAQATCNLVPERASVPTLKPTIATAAVSEETTEWQIPEERVEGPTTWSSFYEAFADQIPEQPPELDTGAVTAPIPTRGPRRRSVLLPALVGIVALLVAILVVVLAVPRLLGVLAPADPIVVEVPSDPVTDAPTPDPAEEPDVDAGGEPAAGLEEPGPPDEAQASTPPATTTTPTPPVEPRQPTPTPPAPDPPVAAEEPPPVAPAPAVAAAGPGQLRVNSVPWSEVYVDGAYLGRTGTPSFELPAGRHTVRLFQPQGDQQKFFHVYVSEDATVNVGCWNFETESPCGGSVTP